MPLDDFAERFVRRFPHLIGHRIVVALSGGPDSVALLRLLGEPHLELILEAAHVHHSVRGDEADRDAEFCRQLCADLQLPFHLLRLERRRAAPEGREASWRVNRYRVLRELAQRLGAAAVATGHHRDDVAEGVMMQLLRGAGPRALAGIEAETSSGLIRPLLDWGRAEILDWLRERGVSWREDSSNRDLSHLRNRVRHIVLPDLRALSPQLDRHLVALARELATDEDCLASELALRARWIEPWSADGGVSVAEIAELPPALRSRWLHAQVGRQDIGKVTRRQLELFHGLVTLGAPRAVTLAGRWRLLSSGGRLWLEPPDQPPPYAFDLAEGAAVSLPLPGWHVRTHVGGAPDPLATWYRPTTCGLKITVRSPRPGDLVMDGARRLQVSRLLARALPRHLRRSWPVLCENDTIAWIPGVWQAPGGEGLLVEVTENGRAAGSLHR